MVNFPVNPARMALINVDMQNVFVEETPDGLVVLNRINHLAEVCREAGIPVVHVRHVLLPDASNAGVFGELVPEAKEGARNPDSEGAAWHKDLIIAPEDIRLEKPRFGAFHATDLELLLRSHGIDTVMITGIRTNICCDTTAREAMQREFRVFFLSDATATCDGEDISAAELQKATLWSMRIIAQVLSADEMIEKIRHAASITDKFEQRTLT